MLTITGVGKNIKTSYMCALVIMQYIEEKSISLALHYLHQIYKFLPKIIYIDYFQSLKNSF